MSGLLAAGAEVWWATTWQRGVLPHAHLAGIPELPVVEFDEVVDPFVRFGWSAAEWKLKVLHAFFPGRAVCWVDDQARGLGALHPKPSDRFRVVAPASRSGLTRREAATVDRWVAWQRACAQGELTDPHGMG